MAKKKVTKTYKTKKYYGDGKYFTKRPMWEWIVIYIVLGLVLYAAFYFFVLKPNNSSSMSSGTTNSLTY